MSDLVDLIDKLAGRSNPVFYRGIIWIDRNGKWSLLDGDSFLFDEDMFQEYDFKDNLTSTDGCPDISGLYRMKIKLHSYQSNNYDDPVEWDVSIHVVDWEILNKSWTDRFE